MARGRGRRARGAVRGGGRRRQRRRRRDGGVLDRPARRRPPSRPSAPAQAMAEQIRRRGRRGRRRTRCTGPVVRSVLLFAEQQDADLIVCGASTRGRVARRLLGDTLDPADPARPPASPRHHAAGTMRSVMTATQPQRDLRHQAGRPARRRHAREGDRAQARGRRARPDRARPRRDHRHRHLRHHRRGDRRRRARRSSSSFVLAGVTCAFSALCLRRAGLLDPGLGQRLHLLLRDARRAGRVDHRLGPDPRVRRLGRRRSPSAGASTSTSCSTRSSASRCPSRSPARPGTAAPSTCPRSFLVLAVTARADRRRARDARSQHDHGRDQARRAGAVHRARRHARSTATTSTPFFVEARASAGA